MLNLQIFPWNMLLERKGEALSHCRCSLAPAVSLFKSSRCRAARGRHSTAFQLVDISGQQQQRKRISEVG